MSTQTSYASKVNTQSGPTCSASQIPLPHCQNNPYPLQQQTLHQRLSSVQKPLEERISPAVIPDFVTYPNNIVITPPSIIVSNTPTPHEPEREDCEVQHCIKDSHTKRYAPAHWVVTEVDEYGDLDDDSDDDEDYGLPTRQFYACNRCVRIYKNKKRTATKTILSVAPYTPEE